MSIVSSFVQEKTEVSFSFGQVDPRDHFEVSQIAFDFFKAQL
jgi:hypothetical protein